MSTYAETHAGLSAVRKWKLLYLGFGSPLRLTNADIRVGASGQKWLPYPWTLDGLTSKNGEIEGPCQVTLANADGTISALVLTGTAVGTPVSIYDAWMDPDGRTMAAEQVVTLFTGQIRNYSLDETAATVTLSLAPVDTLTSISLPTKEPQQLCAHLFQDEGCASTGAATACDGTPTSCQMTDKINPPASGGNYVRFGGFPSMTPETP